MIIFKLPADLQRYIGSANNSNRVTSFIPTMGALHNGHVSLVQNAKTESGLVICSIFVNPTQFNDPKDFEKYPVTLEKDIYALEKAGCDILFLPSVADIYPDGATPTDTYDLGALEQVLEGKFRPGHFQGVCQVMNRLLNIVDPVYLYLGQKDFQQCMVITKLVELTGIRTRIIVCPTSREPDGLAMSSRNLRLNDAERLKATGIYKALCSISDNIKPGELDPLKEAATTSLVLEGFRVDYVEVADVRTLELINEWDGERPVVTLAAAYLNEVRLIDNIIIRNAG